jgi:hypothetical protein
MKKMIKFIKKMRWYVWLFLAWPVLNIIYFVVQEKNYYAAFFAGVYYFMVFLFLHCMETIKKTLQKNGSEFENAVALENLYKENANLISENKKMEEKNETLMLKNFAFRSALSKKDLEIKKMQKDQNSYLIRILLENKELLKMCDDLLIEGDAKYPNDDWKKIDFKEHFKKAKGHLSKEIKGEISDHCAPHGVSALVRIIFAMINKYKKY